MKNVFLVLFLLINVSVFSQSKTYESPNIKEKIKIHKKVAIIPFETRITFKKRPEKFDSLVVKEQEKNISEDIQNTAFNFLISKSKYLTVEIQDVEKTNFILKKAGLLGNIEGKSREEIAQLLGVDAIVTGKFEIEVTKSDLMGMASNFLFANGNTGTGALTMKIYDGSDGDMLWNFYYSRNDNFSKSSKELIEQIMKKVVFTFPYKKYR